MKKALVCFTFVLPAITLAQVTEEWVAGYGSVNGFEYTNAISVDGSGNVYVTGFCCNEDANIDYVTIKYSSEGNEEWVARHDAKVENGDAEAVDLALDAEGNVYVTGYSWGGEVTMYDYATIKYNTEGEEQWIAYYNGPGNDWDWAACIALDAAGNVYVTGRSRGVGGDYDYATVKYNPSGEEQWVARYNGPDMDTDVAWDMAVDEVGNVYVTGWSFVANTEEDYVTIKYDSDGAEEWIATYNGYGNYWDEATCLAIDGKGNVFVSGESALDDYGAEYATVKYDQDGNQVWVARYEGLVDSWGTPNDIVVDDAGNSYVVGGSEATNSFDDFITIKYNPSGEEQWVVRYNGEGNVTDEASAVAVDGTGNVYVTGKSVVIPDGSWDCTTIKYDSEGNQQWFVTYNGSADQEDCGNAIALDNLGNVYVTGYQKGESETMDFLTIKYSQGPGVVEASPLVPGHRLEVTQLTPQPTISYTLPVSTHVSLKVYDVTGQLVRTLVTGSQEAGTHTLTWDASDYPAGLYFVRLEAGEYSVSAKLIVR